MIPSDDDVRFVQLVYYVISSVIAVHIVVGGPVVVSILGVALLLGVVARVNTVRRITFVYYCLGVAAALKVLAVA